MIYTYSQSVLDAASLVVIQGLLDKVKRAMDEGRTNSDQIHELVRRTQQLAIECRLLYGRADRWDDRQEAKARFRSLGYCCERRAGQVRIELPLLLPKRGTDASFIADPLHELLSLEDCPARFRDCTVVFQHIYGEDKRTADIRDHDNIESRAVLNVIERYFLVSDSGVYCANVQMTGTGKTNKTVITLLPGRLDLFQVKKAVSG